MYARTLRGGSMQPSIGEYDAPTIPSGESVGLSRTASSGSTQRTSRPSACCIAIRSRASAASASLRATSR